MLKRSSAIPGGLLFCFCATALSGCSHYLLPASRLESPEACGRPRASASASGDSASDGHPRSPASPRRGRIELLAASMATDLNAPATLSYPDPETGGSPVAHAQKSIVPSFGYVLGLDDKLDVGVRLQAQAPFTLRLKYQVSGLPESEARPGNISVSISVAPGLLLGSEGSRATSIFSGDFTLLGGYRLSENHLFSLSPFFGFGSMSGASETAESVSGGNGASSSATASGGATASSGSSASASQFGAALGYQYQLEALLLRAELAYVSGSIGTTQIGGLFFGGMLGFSL